MTRPRLVDALAEFSGVMFPSERPNWCAACVAAYAAGWRAGLEFRPELSNAPDIHPKHVELFGDGRRAAREGRPHPDVFMIGDRVVIRGNGGGVIVGDEAVDDSGRHRWRVRLADGATVSAVRSVDLEHRS